MATNVRGRSGSRSRTVTGSFGQGGKGTLSRTKTQSIPAAYKGCNQIFCNKINSFKTLVNQTQGSAKFGRPSPTTLNSFANWINRGAIIQTISPTQVAKWAKNTKKTFSTRNCTPTTCKSVLAAKFGKNTIKAVARTKTGQFMVACAPTIGGKPFCLPK